MQRLQGMDVSIGGVEAYSTLGWFNDPIMSSRCWAGATSACRHVDLS
jgi:predicted aminopeptidase